MNDGKKKYIVKKIISKKIMTDKEISDKEGTFFDDDNIKIFKNDVDVYTESGELLLKFRKNVISTKDCAELQVFDKAASSSRRPIESGIPKKDKSKYTKKVRSKKSGKIYEIFSSKKRIKSGIIGYYDSISNFRSVSKEENEGVRCRTTAFTKKHMDKFKNCLPIFKRIDRIYKKLVPTQYGIQKKAINKINKKFVIDDTIFTTVTVNKNFRTALHRDSGDLKEGFGNLVVVSDTDDYEGGYTMFPQYGVGVDCRSGDFLAMNVHEWHCNSEKKGLGNRYSFVFYLREKMLKTCPNN